MRATATIPRGPTRRATRRPPGRPNSHRKWTDSRGPVTFGNTTTSIGTFTTALQYTGAYQDPTTGLYYLNARYYDPTTAQFLTRDPLEAETRQPYEYASDDPIDRTDPAGLCDSDVFSGGFWGGGNCISGLVGGPDGGGGESVGGVVKSVAGIAGGAAAVVGVVATGGIGAGATEAFAGGAEGTFTTFEGGYAWVNGSTAAAESAASAAGAVGTVSGLATAAVDCAHDPTSVSCIWNAGATAAGLGLAVWPGGAIAAWLGVPLAYPWDRGIDGRRDC
jgi:RHS repeat-associated protein